MICKKALQNPHYKKIWEKVIMNKHQDCDSIEKALLHESTHKGCLIALNDKPCHILPIDDGLVEYNFMRPNIAKLIHIEDPEDGDIQCPCCEQDIYSGDIPGNIAKINKVKFFNIQILGTPITLEDIIIVLKSRKKPIYPLISFKDVNDNVCYLSVILEQEVTDIAKNGIQSLFLFSWQLTKPLHEQTLETWEKITNLID